MVGEAECGSEPMTLLYGVFVGEAVYHHTDLLMVEVVLQRKLLAGWQLHRRVRDRSRGLVPAVIRSERDSEARAERRPRAGDVPDRPPHRALHAVIRDD